LTKKQCQKTQEHNDQNDQEEETAALASTFLSLTRHPFLNLIDHLLSQLSSIFPLRL
jgi:hypothetical protein